MESPNKEKCGNISRKDKTVQLYVEQQFTPNTARKTKIVSTTGHYSTRITSSFVEKRQKKEEGVGTPPELQ